MDRPSRKRIEAITDSGRMLVLGDGSAWLIEPDDRGIAAGWAVGTRVQVSMKGHPESVITNREDGSEIRVVYAGQR
jgi:hypothetical protein